MEQRLTVATVVLGLMLLVGCAGLKTSAGKLNVQAAYEVLAYGNRLALLAHPALSVACLTARQQWACAADVQWTEHVAPLFTTASDLLTKALQAYEAQQDVATADKVRIAEQAFREALEEVLALVYGEQ